MENQTNEYLFELNNLANPDYHRMNREAGQNDRLLHAVMCAYAKHVLGYANIGWEELDSILLNALTNELGDEEFCKWVDKFHN